MVRYRGARTGGSGRGSQTGAGSLDDTEELPILTDQSAGRWPQGWASGPSDHTWVDVPARVLLQARRRWLTLAGRGILMLVVGCVALVTPGPALPQALVGFGALGLAGGAVLLVDVVRAAGPSRTVLVVQAVLWVAAGLAALVWPSPSLLVAFALVGGWALASGVVEVVAALAGRVGRAATGPLVLAGGVSTGLGGLLVLRRDLDLAGFAVLVGALVAVAGSLLLVAAARLRRLPRM